VTFATQRLNRRLPTPRALVLTRPLQPRLTALCLPARRLSPAAWSRIAEPCHFRSKGEPGSVKDLSVKDPARTSRGRPASSVRLRPQHRPVHAPVSRRHYPDQLRRKPHGTLLVALPSQQPLHEPPGFRQTAQWETARPEATTSPALLTGGFPNREARGPGSDPSCEPGHTRSPGCSGSSGESHPARPNTHFRGRQRVQDFSRPAFAEPLHRTRHSLLERPGHSLGTHLAFAKFSPSCSSHSHGPMAGTPPLPGVPGKPLSGINQGSSGIPVRSQPD